MWFIFTHLSAFWAYRVLENINPGPRTSQLATCLWHYSVNVTLAVSPLPWASVSASAKWGELCLLCFPYWITQKPNIKHREGIIIIICKSQLLPGLITVQDYKGTLIQSEFHLGKKSDGTSKSSNSMVDPAPAVPKDAEPQILPFSFFFYTLGHNSVMTMTVWAAPRIPLLRNFTKMLTGNMPCPT